MHRSASLSGLPTELRLSIWQFALQDSECHIRRGRSEKKPTRSIWALLHVNQQIRAEVLPMFFPMVTIHLREDLTERDLETWLDVIGPRAVCEMKKTHLYSRRMCAGSRPDETYNCHRQAFYYTELRESQIADMVVLQGYRPTMFFRLLPDICSRGHLSCFRKTVKQLELSGSEDWYMAKDETLSKDRLMKLWRALNIDHRAG
ncbi:uncharacterized protein RCC_11403 [Ramularia collo-cygni]|uniref:2EXR domain-containing protein n=1 Tax=Ramularia collo-cygni TaxID=112498 RepID=A0A2D3VNR2_9PEZI|nr:uncharacterized protein RCC_11403 [Ramularia collo-cygni]CZT25734.1 uncharacterized protein RCC_11403 [Ramularia collo-cygni]